MNNKFDELTKSLAQSVTRRGALKKFGVSLAGVALAGALALPVHSQGSTLGPLVELSQPNPVGTCDDGFRIPGITLNDTFEPYLTVNPRNPNNVVATWTLGPIQNVVAGVSFNGGRTWQQVPLPLTLCSGGAYAGAGDPWLSFAPNGDLYAINLAGSSPSSAIATVIKSTDGGLHWSPPALLSTGSDLTPGRPTITVDLNNPLFVYAFWHGEGIKNTLPLIFARSADGGVSWEPARILYAPGANRGADFGQAFALPDGSVVALLYDFGFLNKKQQSVQVLRSTDHGQSWSGPIGSLSMMPLSFENFGFSSALDPETGVYVHDPTDPMLAVDNRNGNLYAVWEDGRFSNFQYNDIAFSRSVDGGVTWSTPVRVNQTPIGIPLLNRQAFLPAIAVRNDGTIGVSYYDFRFNDSNPGLPTDYWMVRCDASGLSPTDSANWRGEVRLTDASFDLQHSINFNGYFLGDYVGGLAASGNGFVALFTGLNGNNTQNMFARRIEN
jgi:hypothetical protein